MRGREAFSEEPSANSRQRLGKSNQLTANGLWEGQTTTPLHKQQWFVKLKLVKIRDLLKLIEADGWRMVAQKGSHRQFKHPSKPGRVTIPGHPGDDLATGTLKSIYRQAQIKEKSK